MKKKLFFMGVISQMFIINAMHRPSEQELINFFSQHHASKEWFLNENNTLNETGKNLALYLPDLKIDIIPIVRYCGTKRMYEHKRLTLERLEDTKGTANLEGANNAVLQAIWIFDQQLLQAIQELYNQPAKNALIQKAIAKKQSLDMELTKRTPNDPEIPIIKKKISLIEQSMAFLGGDEILKNLPPIKPLPNLNPPSGTRFVPSVTGPHRNFKGNAQFCWLAAALHCLAANQTLVEAIEKKKNTNNFFATLASVFAEIKNINKHTPIEIKPIFETLIQGNQSIFTDTLSKLGSNFFGDSRYIVYELYRYFFEKNALPEIKQKFEMTLYYDGGNTRTSRLLGDQASLINSNKTSIISIIQDEDSHCIFSENIMIMRENITEDFIQQWQHITTKNTYNKKERLYQCFAIAYNTGNYHYVAFIKNNHNEWFKYDDLYSQSNIFGQNIPLNELSDALEKYLDKNLNKGQRSLSFFYTSISNDEIITNLKQKYADGSGRDGQGLRLIVGAGNTTHDYVRFKDAFDVTLTKNDENTVSVTQKDLPSLIVDFNDSEKMNTIFSQLEGMFSLIIFDHAVQTFLDNPEALAILSKALKPGGSLIFFKRAEPVEIDYIEQMVNDAFKKNTFIKFIIYDTSHLYINEHIRQHNTKLIKACITNDIEYKEHYNEQYPLLESSNKVVITDYIEFLKKDKDPLDAKLDNLKERLDFLQQSILTLQRYVTLLQKNLQ